LPVVTKSDFVKLACGLEGTVAGPHFDRTAFKVKRNFATLAADGLTANLRLRPEEQELKCLTYPEAFAPVPNAWGRRGWTTATLSNLTMAELRDALEMAWRHADGQKRRKTWPIETC
jgi:hypothetical protein